MKSIELIGVKQNNLKDINVKIPLGKFTVICGPSGSGKSSLAFETLYAEGQRRYIESMSNYSRQFLGKAPKPDVEEVRNIPPAVAIEQKNSVKTSRSTVGTTTEVLDYLRLFFEKIGRMTCPTSGVNIERESVSVATEKVISKFLDKRGYILAPLPESIRPAKGQELTKALLVKGYTKIFVKESKKKKDKEKISLKPCDENPEMSLKGFELIDLKPQWLPSDETFYVVIDRLAFSTSEKQRIAESVAQAYALSNGQARILTTENEELSLSEYFSCSKCGFIFPAVTSQLFAFNSPVGACADCKGFGNKLEIDVHKVIPNPEMALEDGVINPFKMPSATYERRELKKYCLAKKIPMNVSWTKLTEEQRQKIWQGDGKWWGVEGLFKWLEGKKYKMHVRVFLSHYKSPFVCTTCNGTRLRSESEFVKIDGKSFSQLTQMTVREVIEFLKNLNLSKSQKDIAKDILRELNSRLDFLSHVGVDYLPLNRPTRTLSGGEFQRINLAKQLGMGLSQTLFVLDEPTVGLHPRDNDRLIVILKKLKELGNTLVVVEHDRDVIKNAEYIFEMGPGSGQLGGEVVFSGESSEFYKNKKSLTASYLSGRNSVSGDRRVFDKHKLKFALGLTGCTGNNLKDISIKFPLNRIVTVTGVSGSGKSTLVSKTLYPALAKKLNLESDPAEKFAKLSGSEFIKNVLFVDQNAVGKTARSNPATYLKVYDKIREIFAATTEAKERGYAAGSFSLNVDGGRCGKCKGLGHQIIDMMFMDDVKLLCDECDGKRFRNDLLEVKVKGKNINEILNMTAGEAHDFFVQYQAIRKPLNFLKEVGLDYIKLGQSSNSLSGGESQRLKIAKEFLDAKLKDTLFILDEPTTGLHFREIELLLKVLDRLVDAGASVILIEHNMDVICKSDYIIDLGPEAGNGGGEIVAEGRPEEIAKCKQSLTGKYLREYL